MASQPITEHQFNLLLERVKDTEKNKDIAMRDTLLFEICYYLGFRPGEARLIEVSQINFHEKTIYIPAINNKERHEDNFPIPEFMLEKIKNYLQRRSIKSKWLFPCLLHHNEKEDKVLLQREPQRKFTEHMRGLGFLHVSYYDKQGKPRYNLNLYSFRKRFGTQAYLKLKCPKKTANLLRHYDPQLKSVWRYVFTAQKEERGDLINELYPSDKPKEESPKQKEIIFDIMPLHAIGKLPLTNKH
jgi:integrase